ncbi:MerR family transcriptional regulator [Paenibacillus sp. sptzw28]|uniref:MerR family transcriptional regulator n=1 Tax=Paenibacillus sp. sptzw28 TaxID=715179 RepID=UPI001C6E3228|nr:MerR family transcriptional regulator [Paenibacillus sp. sptzw28]QYR21303.1 MerR family transcriptional regulator [Paenibacillus sp. sptzw28]
MNTYTAKQITDQLRNDDPEMNLRTVRYYTQIGIIPPLELVGNKRVYTDKHLHFFRAILTLSRTGETLASIQEKLNGLTMEDIIRIGEKLTMYKPNGILENETHQVSEDVYLTLSPRVSAELRQKMIETVSQLIKGDRGS